MRRRMTIWLGLAAVMAAMLACGGAGQATPAAIEAPADTVVAATAVPLAPTDTPALPTDTPEPPTPVAVATYLGDAVEGYGLGLAAVSVEDPGTPGLLYQPEAGKHLVRVEFIVANRTDGPLNVNPLNAVMVDADGFTYQPELGSTDDQIATIALLPGQKVRGSVGFQVPDGSVPAAIKYGDTFSSDIVKASLETPPADHLADLAGIEIDPPAMMAPIGEEATGAGYGVTAETLEDPAPPGLLHEPRPGYRLVAVEVVVSNSGQEPLSVNPLNASLVDEAGFVYTPELGGRDGQLATVDLSPGERVRGWVAFSVPEDAIPVGLRYSDGMFEEALVQVGVR